MKRHTRLSRTSRLRRRGRPRYRSYVADKPYQAWIRSLPCVIAGKHECKGVIQCCHLKTRGSSGKDAANVFPGCVAAHDEQGHSIVSFERKYRVHLRAIARELWNTYQGERCR